MAVIFSPTVSFEESPIVSGCKRVEFNALTLTTAMSKSLSIPITSPMYDSPSRNVTVTFDESCTTC